uniref:ATP-grasp domain-containing protein n=1 Tax=Syphacia muris TaxID=451379 RepID=A0A0N5AH46_9BILA
MYFVELNIAFFSVDVLYAVEGPRNFRDHDHSQLNEKIREVAIKYGNDTRRLCVFERALRKEAAAVRQCSMMQSHSEDCVKKAKTQLGGFPIFIKPARPGNKCVHSFSIASNPEEMRAWIKVIICYLVLTYGVISLGSIATIDQSQTLYECVKNKKPYAVEYLNVEQCRNCLPGIESFVNKAIKSLDLRHFAKNLLFIKGFYKAHNLICFISASFEPRSETDYRLLQEANNSVSWEVLHLGCVLEDLGITRSDCFAPKFPDRYFMVINFPKVEGVLLHQTNIPRRTADMRVAWRVSEGEELYDCDSIDDNILQVFLSHTDRRVLLSEAAQIIENTEITVDRACIFEESNACDRTDMTTNHNCNQRCGDIN